MQANAVFAAKTIERDTELVLGRETVPSLPPDALYHPLCWGQLLVVIDPDVG